MTNCFKMVTCGWCSSTNLCIPGNRIGPLAPCVANSYIYTNNGLTSPLITNPTIRIPQAISVPTTPAIPLSLGLSIPRTIIPSSPVVAQTAPVMPSIPLATALIRQPTVNSLIANGQLKGTPGASAIARDLNPLNRTVMLSNPAMPMMFP